MLELLREIRESCSKNMLEFDRPEILTIFLFMWSHAVHTSSPPHPINTVASWAGEYLTLIEETHPSGSIYQKVRRDEAHSGGFLRDSECH